MQKSGEAQRKGVSIVGLTTAGIGCRSATWPDSAILDMPAHSIDTGRDRCRASMEVDEGGEKDSRNVEERQAPMEMREMKNSVRKKSNKDKQQEKRQMAWKGIKR